MARQDNWGGAALILVGIVFLLSNFDIVPLHELYRFWPLILIAIGARMLVRRRGAGSEPDSGPPPPPP